MGQISHDDERWMRRALALARRAREINEVPVGAVLVHGGQVLGEGWNQPIANSDPSAHAEIVALRQAAARVRNYRLVGTTLYVTKEPCVMCAGAIVQARIKRVVVGAPDTKAGAAGSVFNLLQSDSLNHQCEIECGVLARDCSALLLEFFTARRPQNTKTLKSNETDH